jgi:hypothetical protein
MFNCIDIYSFIPVGGFVGRGSRALLCPDIPGEDNNPDMNLFDKVQELTKRRV